MHRPHIVPSVMSCLFVSSLREKTHGFPSVCLGWYLVTHTLMASCAHTHTLSLSLSHFSFDLKQKQLRHLYIRANSKKNMQTLLGGTCLHSSQPRTHPLTNPFSPPHNFLPPPHLLAERGDPSQTRLMRTLDDPGANPCFTTPSPATRRGGEGRGGGKDACPSFSCGQRQHTI